jgi:hypothetical protein
MRKKEKKIAKNARYTLQCSERSQDRTGQDRTGQDRTGQDRTGQDTTQDHITAQHTAPHHSPVDSAVGQQGQTERPFGAVRTGGYSEILPVHS